MLEDLATTLLRLARESGLGFWEWCLVLLILGVVVYLGGKIGTVAWRSLPRPTPAPDVDEGGPVSPGTVVNSDPRPPEDHGG